MNINYKEYKVLYTYAFVISLLFIIIKINLFINFFPRFDSAFYIKWIIDLNNSIRIFPEGEGSIFYNIYTDYNSLSHNYLKRIYNNVALLYHSVPVFLNYLFGEIFNFYYKTFNLLSIIANVILSLIFACFIINTHNLKKNNLLIILLIIYLFFSSFCSIFYLAPLGFHNYSLISLLLSFLILENNYDKIKFLNIKIISLGLLLPIFTHHFNLLIIFFTMVAILTIRYYKKNEILKDAITIILIFLIALSPILIMYKVGQHNTKLLNIFFSLGVNDQNIVLIEKLLFYFLNNMKMFVVHFWGHLGIFGSILFFISYIRSKSFFLKIFLLIITLIFILFPLHPYFDRLFNYFLLFALLLICREFIISYKNISYKSIFFVLFILTIINNFLQISVKNLRSDFNDYLINRFPNSEIWEKRFMDIVDHVGDSKIIFFDYQAVDPFYAVFNKQDINKKIYNINPVTNLYERYINNDENYFRINKIDKSFYKDTYVMFFSLKKDKKDFLDKVCYLQKIYFNECFNIEIIDQFNFAEPLEYQHGNHNFQLILYKSN